MYFLLNMDVFINYMYFLSIIGTPRREELSMEVFIGKTELSMEVFIGKTRRHH